MMKNIRTTSLYLAISALASPIALANPANYQHANGSTVVDINTADANGLSHNLWSKFDVNSKGMILNNSPVDVIRENGSIPKNNNLTTSAKVILNEVISNQASQLKGALEVVGQTADIIVANPNGITCTGCSFINTNRTTLTTGSPVMLDGKLTGFNVRGGTITLDGMTSQQNYTAILAESVKINGQLNNTDSLTVIAGKYTYNADTGAVVSTEPNSSIAGIDISALGGVTAGVIQLQTTQAGSGVNNKGVISADTLQISSNGILSNSGTISAQTLIATSVNNLSNTGSLKGSAIQLATASALNNTGTVEATTALYATTGGNIVNKGTMKGGSVNQLVASAGDITNSGTLASEGVVNLLSGYVQDASGALTPYANTSITNNNNGTITGTNNVSVRAVKAVNLNSGSLSSQGPVYLEAQSVTNHMNIDARNLTVYSNNFSNHGKMTTSEALVATGLSSITNRGTLQGDVVTLNTAGRLDTQKCKLFILCFQGTISADSKIVINAPSVSSISSIGGKIIAPTIELNTTGF